MSKQFEFMHLLPLSLCIFCHKPIMKYWTKTLCSPSTIHFEEFDGPRSLRSSMNCWKCYGNNCDVLRVFVSKIPQTSWIELSLWTKHASINITQRLKIPDLHDLKIPCPKVGWQASCFSFLRQIWDNAGRNKVELS